MTIQTCRYHQNSPPSLICAISTASHTPGRAGATPRNYLHTQRVRIGIYILSVPLRAERESLGCDHVLYMRRCRCDDEWEQGKNLANVRRPVQSPFFLVACLNPIGSRKILPLFALEL